MTSRKDDDSANEPSSPACSMHEADNAYMGYAGREELTVILTELLEAERAGVRVTHECARTAGDARVAELMRAIEAPARPCSCPLADLSDLAPGRLVAMIEFV